MYWGINIYWYALLYAIHHIYRFLKGDEKIRFEVAASRTIDSPPSIRVRFDNGITDDIELSHYRVNEAATLGCNYLGHLRREPTSSSIAVTGCIDKPGDSMDITLISKNNAQKMFSVDFYGNAEAIKNPFENGGM